METLLPLLAGGALGGVAVGVFSGMLGIGGGTLMIPLFRLAFGLSPMEATATSLFCVVPTSLSGAVQHIRNKTSLLKLGITAGVAGALTSPLGVRLAQASPEWLVMLAAAIIIAWSAAKMFSKARKMPKTRTAPANTASQSVSPAKSAQGNVASASRTLTRRQLLQGALIGLGAGLASGYVGVGGGFLMVPLFLSVIGTTAHQASGTSLVAVMHPCRPRRGAAGASGQHRLRRGHRHLRGVHPRSHPGRPSGHAHSRTDPPLRLRLLPASGCSVAHGERTGYTLITKPQEKGGPTHEQPRGPGAYAPLLHAGDVPVHHHGACRRGVGLEPAFAEQRLSGNSPRRHRVHPFAYAGHASAHGPGFRARPPNRRGHEAVQPDAALHGYGHGAQLRGRDRLSAPKRPRKSAGCCCPPPAP